MQQAGVPIATSGQTINYAKVSGHIFFYNESLIVKSLLVQEIEDNTEKDLVQLRKTIYLIIMSAVQFEECCHKLLKLQIRAG